MFAKLFKPRAAEAPPPCSVPPGQRVYAIGDIHGCADLLDALMAKVDADNAARGPAETTLIFLGDLVDRGPWSAHVVERLRRLAASRPTSRFLLGNHEEVFLSALDGDAKALRLFSRIGGKETVMSYGVSEEEYDAMDFAQLAEALRRIVPSDHRAFLTGFEDMVTIGDYVFVHAGVRPDVDLAEQRPGDLRWIRDPFLDHGKPLGKMVVHGHTITEALDVQPHRIGVDTGAYISGKLTALGLEGEESWTVSTRD